MQRYGSFAGKTEEVLDPISLSRGLYDWVRGLYHGEYVPNS